MSKTRGWLHFPLISFAAHQMIHVYLFCFEFYRLCKEIRRHVRHWRC